MDLNNTNHRGIFKVIITMITSAIFLSISQFIIQATTYNNLKHTITWKLQTTNCLLYFISLLISIINLINLRRQRINYNLYIHCQTLLFLIIGILYMPYMIIDAHNSTILNVIIASTVISVDLCVVFFYLVLLTIFIGKMKLCDRCYNSYTKNYNVV